MVIHEDLVMKIFGHEDIYTSLYFFPHILLPLIQEQISVKYSGKALYIRDATKFLKHRLMQHSIMTKWSVVFGSQIDLSATYREAYTYRETMTSLL